MRLPLGRGILLTAVASVLTATGLVVLAVVLSRPVFRDAIAQQLVANAELEACDEDPETWGSPFGPLSMFGYDPSGVSLNPSAPPMEPELLALALAFGRPARTRDASGRNVVVLAVGDTGPCAVVRMTTRFPDAPLFGAFTALALGAAVFGSLLAALGSFVWVRRPLRTRVEALSRAAAGVGFDDFIEGEQAPDALGVIADVLARSHRRIVEARDALERRNQALEDHLAGIAHDLRTPLASMQLALESLAGSDRSDAEDARRALADVVYLSSLVENLHQGVRLRHGLDMADAKVDLVYVVERLALRYAILGRHAGVEVAAWVPEESVWAAAPPSLAERAIANVVQNAIEHNEEGGHVAIVLSVENGRFTLRIDDDGPGFPEHLRASLAAEAFLLDAARTRGPGLGMVITAEVAKRTGWKLSYTSMEPGGVRVCLSGEVVGPP